MLDFYDMQYGGNDDRSPEDNRLRWSILVKGLGGMMPGQRYKPSELAAKMIRDIETKHERYVPWVDQAKKDKARNGKN